MPANAAYGGRSSLYVLWADDLLKAAIRTGGQDNASMAGLALAVAHGETRWDWAVWKEPGSAFSLSHASLGKALLPTTFSASTWFSFSPVCLCLPRLPLRPHSLPLWHAQHPQPRDSKYLPWLPWLSAWRRHVAGAWHGRFEGGTGHQAFENTHCLSPGVPGAFRTALTITWLVTYAIFGVKTTTWALRRT